MEHKLIQGGEQYLPFARSRIKALRAAGLDYASQQFEIDGCSVSIRIAKEHAYIRLGGGGAGYQFFSTGDAVQYDTGAFGLPIYYGYALKAGPKTASKALASSLESSVPGDPKQWNYAASPAEITLEFPKKNLWQIEGIAQHAFYPQVNGALDPATVLVSSWCSADQLQSLSVLGGKPFNRSRFDVTYDSAPCLFEKNAALPLGYSGLAPDADWYKRAAIRTVVHPTFGARRFIIMSDISGAFHVYPTGTADETLREPANALYPGQAIKTNVPEAVVQRQNTPWPAWCRQPTGSARQFFPGNSDNDYELVRKFPQYRWAFNSAGTKACSVVFEDLPAIALNDPASTKPFRADAGVERDLQESLPGLIELDIQIELTGSRPEDFVFTLALAQSLRPTATQQYVLAADYAWRVKDPVNPDTPFTELDDLVLALGGIYHTLDTRVSADKFLDVNNAKTVIEISNQTQGRVVRTFLASSTNRPYAVDSRLGWLLGTLEDKFQDADASLLAVDLRILAFVVQQRYSEEFFEVHALDGGSTQRVVERGTQRVKTYAYNLLQDEIALDKGTPLDTALAAAYADTAVAGLFKLPLDEVGAFYGVAVVGQAVKYRSAYDALDVLDVGYLGSQYRNTANEVNIYGGNLHASAYLYATRMATVMQLSHRDRFAVSPNGSWSVTTTPIFYYSGVVRPSSASAFTQFNDWFDLGLMRQSYVDIVSLQAVRSAPPVRTTHLALFNKAFGKSLTAEDFSCAFSLFEDTLAWTSGGINGTTVMHYILAETPSTAKLYIHLYGQSVDGGAIPKFHLPAELLHKADARVLNQSVFSAPPLVTGFAGDLSTSYTLTQAPPEFSPLVDHTAVLNGSTLFY
jgi:hypothetical protein